MDIYLNKAHFPVTVLGPGRRIGLWFQGCSNACPGCVSRDTWHKDESSRMSVQTLLDWCKNKHSDQLDGITISGGEPFEQPEALEELLHGLDKWKASLTRPFDILCYSGLSYTVLKERYNTILMMLDAIIPEPYIREEQSDKQWRGSANQPLILLSDLARKRAYFQNHHPDGKHIQFVVDDFRIWFIGVPLGNDMEKLKIKLQEKGIEMAECSWKA